MVVFLRAQGAVLVALVGAGINGVPILCGDASRLRCCNQETVILSAEFTGANHDASTQRIGEVSCILLPHLDLLLAERTVLVPFCCY